MTDKATDAAAIAAEEQANREIEAARVGDSPNPGDTPQPHLEPRGEDKSDKKDDLPPLERVTASDKGRLSIAERFKANRAQGLDFHGDYRDPAQQYGKYAQAEPEASAPAVGEEPGIGEQPRDDQKASDATERAQQQPPGESPLRKVVVHGVEMYLTEDQIVAEAQKSLAAGNILEMAKEIKDAASQRAPVSRPNQDGEDRTRSEAHPGSEVSPDQDDPFADVVRELQYGDPDTARDKLRKTTASEAQKAAREELLRERYGNERSHRIRAFHEFRKANEDLDKDEFARDAITRQVAREYRADLVALGIAPEQLPKSDVEVADWHMQARTQGKPVRDIMDIFNTSKGRFLEWRGGAKPQPSNPQTNPAARSSAPRVELSPDRTERRAAIPTQPVRASVPMMAPGQAAPSMESKRSSAVQNMRKARGQYVA